MASEAVLNFEELLAPISKENPAGEELKSNPNLDLHKVYQSVKDASDAARDAERKLKEAVELGDELSNIEKPNWRQVERLALGALAKSSKDLWIASWLLEALVRNYGFAGLRDGVQLVRRMCDEYWDQLHPAPDEEEGYLWTLSQLVAILQGYGDEPLLLPSMESVPITDNPAYSSFHYKQALALEEETDEDQRRKRIDDGAVTLASFHQAAHRAGAEFFHELVEDLTQCDEELKAFTSLLKERSEAPENGSFAVPSAKKIHDALEECRSRISEITGEVFPEAAEAPDYGDEPAASDKPQTAGKPASAGGVVASRKEAFELVRRAAEYFEKNEPQSILGYSLRLVIRRGSLSLPELLTELITDESARAEFSRLTGVPEAKSEDD